MGRMRIVKVCKQYAEREICGINTFFQITSIHKYTYSSALKNNVAHKNVNDLILVRGDTMRDVYDVDCQGYWWETV